MNLEVGKLYEMDGGFYIKIISIEDDQYTYEKYTKAKTDTMNGVNFRANAVNFINL